MAKLNTNGNIYTVVYSAVMVIIVAFLLAFVSQALGPTQKANEDNDKKSQILAALGYPKDSVYDVQAAYAEVVSNDMIFGADGASPANEGLATGEGGQHDQSGFTVANKSIAPDNRPLYVAHVNGETKYVVPLTGAGLWGGLWGYLALNDDCETVFGAYFSHESETAGLGSRITEREFQDSFKGKKIHAGGGTGDIALCVVKKGKEGNVSPDNYVDGITGATLTTNGVSDMIQKCVGSYADILKSRKK